VKTMKYLTAVILLISMASCSTVDKFRSYVKNEDCRSYEYAALAFPVNSNGTIDQSNAGVSCGNSLNQAENIAKSYCENNYGNGRKCIATVNYYRSSNRFENVVQQNLAIAKREQNERFYENLKDRCTQIGFQRDTAQHSDCVLKLAQQTEQMQQQQNAINQQQQDRALMQMMQGLQMMNPPTPAPTQTTCNQMGPYLNCTTR
jgi:hypothetical protein